MNFIMVLAVGFTLALTATRAFGPGMPVFWREAAPGVGMGLSKSASASRCGQGFEDISSERCVGV
jgi:hypothetical protein